MDAQGDASPYPLVVILKNHSSQPIDYEPALTFACSGFRPSAGIVITAAHCMDSEESIVVVAAESGDICTSDGWQELVEYEAAFIDLASDVAVLNGPGHEGNQGWAVVGRPTPHMTSHGWQQVGRNGLIACTPQQAMLNRCQVQGPLIQCTVPEGSAVCSGMSGGPLVNSRNEIVGVGSSSDSCSGGTAVFGNLAGSDLQPND